MTQNSEEDQLHDDLEQMKEAGWTLQQDSCSSGSVWQFEIGKTLEGVVRNVRAINVRRGGEVVKARLMTILTGEEFVTVWESAALSGLFDVAKEGDEVCVEYLGEVEMPKPKSPMKDYRVWVRPHDEK